MKKSFPGFYHPSDAEIETAWKSDKTLFVFDTNTLLNLYGYADLTRNDFFSILGKIPDRIWLPYHVVLEYQRRRLSVVRDEKAIFSKVEDCLEKIENVFKSDFSQLALHRRFPALHKKTEKLQSDVKRLVASYKISASHWDKKQPCVRGHDSIREKLNNNFENKTGPIPESQAWLDAIFKDGEERYSNKTPPGFNDSKKSTQEDKLFVYAGLKYERRFGDLIIWKQLIEKAKDENIESVILVTDDAKDDWWYIINSRGEKSIGPRAELREEICTESSIKLFAMYNTADFLDNGKKLLEVNVSDESINDAGNSFVDKIASKHIQWNKFINSKLNENNKSYKEFSEVANLRFKEFEHIKNLISKNDLEKMRYNLEGKYSSSLIDFINRDAILSKKMIDPAFTEKIKKLNEIYRNTNLFSDYEPFKEDDSDINEEDK